MDKVLSECSHHKTLKCEMLWYILTYWVKMWKYGRSLSPQPLAPTIGKWVQSSVWKTLWAISSLILSEILEAKMFQAIHRSSQTPNLMHMDMLIWDRPLDKETTFCYSYLFDRIWPEVSPLNTCPKSYDLMTPKYYFRVVTGHREGQSGRDGVDQGSPLASFYSFLAKNDGTGVSKTVP